MSPARARSRPAAAGLLAALLLVCARAGAVEAEATVAGRKLLLPVPVGHCEVQPHLDADRLGFELYARMIGSDVVLVALFLPCDRMTALRRRELVPRFVAVVAPRLRGEVRGVSDANRAAYVERVVKDAGKIEFKALFEQGARRGGRTGLFGSSTSFDVLGAISEDSEAVYLAYLGVIAPPAATAGATPTAMSAIGGFTLVSDLAIGYVHYDRGADEATLRRLFAAARSSIGQLVVANPQPAGAGPGSGWFDGIDLPRVGIAALIGLVAVGFVAALALLMRRRRGW